MTRTLCPSKTAAARHVACLTMLLCAGLGGGCRPDPGTPVYVNDAMPPITRLTVGAFYLGATSDSFPLDDVTRRLDVFDNTISAIIADNTDRIQGQPATRLVHAGAAYFGMGIDWNNPEDLRRWTTMHVSLKSSDTTFRSFTINMNSGSNIGVNATSYGYRNDGVWHTLDIPIADFVRGGLNPSAVRAPFVLLGPSGSAGATLKIAGLYFDEAQ